MLYLIGLGLGDEKDITIKGLETVKRCDRVYLEAYTSMLRCSVSDLEKQFGKKIILADRELVEKRAEDTILADAKVMDVAFFVVGDVFGATTHVDLVLRAKKAGIPVMFIHNASIINAIGSTGLELYKFGKTTSMVFFEDNWKPTTPFDVIRMNQKNGLHTLVLLDIKADEERYMSVNVCLRQLLELGMKEEEKVVGCARIGQEDQLIKFGTISELIDDDFGEPLHCVVVPGELHFMEEDFLNSLD
ncbi:diphthine synthase [Candidatus Woesearchaeota archaeon]|nr:diphthine synthase [Candidatus Woesearchaeota archaeon]